MQLPAACAEYGVFSGSFMCLEHVLVLFTGFVTLRWSVALAVLLDTLEGSDAHSWPEESQRSCYERRQREETA